MILIDLDSICVGNPFYDYISSYGLRKLCVNGAHDLSRRSLNLEPELIPILDKYEREEFLGTDDPGYNYALNISYNEEGTDGEGSAIFLHCFDYKPFTGGCVAIAEPLMKTSLQKLKPDCQIVMGENLKD